MNFSLVGCGRMGHRRARAIVENPNAELVCVADTHTEYADSLAKELGCEVGSIYEAISFPYTDVVVVSTPNKFHCKNAINAMNHSKNVFCEKPLATTVLDARQMLNVSHINDVSLKVSSNIRYFGNVLKAKELMDKGTIGDVLFLRGWVGHGGWNLKPDSWFVDQEIIGGGTFIDNGCHLLDIVRWYFGDVKECIGYRTTLHHELKGIEDNAMAILITESGKPMFIQSSWTDWNGYLYLELYGTEGVIIIDSRGSNASCTIKYEGHDEVYDYSREPRVSFKKEMDDYIDLLERGYVLPPTGEDGLKVLEIIHGVYRSSEEGRKIAI